ncbi:high affinity copper uptake protein 1-like [Amphibalanus amphitrite]|uniref:high affinity copper uptake protein 1-like n=1 Tax=Amphibalanus amphitrite TaxID=1232801 RepID=UPI001C90AA15|nr:high affinity copper uptake protein 1-like [Amphibalanus amphitrite]
MMSSRRAMPLLLVLAVVVCGCRAAPAPVAASSMVISKAVNHAPPSDTEDTPGPLATDSVGSKQVGMMMQMTFFGGNHFSLWFEGFHVHDAGTLTAACLGVGIMSILFEGLKVFRLILVDRVASSRVSSPGHWLQVFLHIAQVTFGYFLMLATMTYSSWIMIAICAGAGVGYAIFAPMVSKRALLGASDHCQ